MPTNPFFTTHSFNLSNEQKLLEDLIVESVQMNGVDCFYLPRKSDIDYRSLLGEQPDTRFTEAYPIEMYLINVEGYDGENEFAGKFGYMIKASTNIVVTARSFAQYVSQFSSVLTRPREGDLVWVPILRRLFEIKFSDPDINFHAIGRDAARPYYYELRVEQFKFSQENIQTGVQDIDNIEFFNSYTLALNLTVGTGNYIIGEEVYQGNTYLTNTASAKVSDWNPISKVLNVIDIRGQLNVDSQIVGTQSSTAYNLLSYNELDNKAPDATTDNEEINEAVDDFIVNVETNPLGGNL